MGKDGRKRRDGKGYLVLLNKYNDRHYTIKYAWTHPYCRTRRDLDLTLGDRPRSLIVGLEIKGVLLDTPCSTNQPRTQSSIPKWGKKGVSLPSWSVVR